MHLRDSQCHIVISCDCGASGPLPYSALRSQFQCVECGSVQQLSDERVKAIETALADALSMGAARIAAGEERARVEVRIAMTEGD